MFKHKYFHPRDRRRVPSDTINHCGFTNFDVCSLISIYLTSIMYVTQLTFVSLLKLQYVFNAKHDFSLNQVVLVPKPNRQRWPCVYHHYLGTNCSVTMFTFIY